MGLDQHAEDGSGKWFAEWRKHNRLDGWMENLFREKGGEGQFNLVKLELTMDDIINLEKDVLAMELPSTLGFFYGRDSYEEYNEEFGDKQLDIEFIHDAKELLDNGDKVIYSNWW